MSDSILFKVSESTFMMAGSGLNQQEAFLSKLSLGIGACFLGEHIICIMYQLGAYISVAPGFILLISRGYYTTTRAHCLFGGWEEEEEDCWGSALLFPWACIKAFWYNNIQTLFSPSEWVSGGRTPATITHPHLKRLLPRTQERQVVQAENGKRQKFP